MVYGKNVVLSWFRICHHVISCRLRLLIISFCPARSQCSHSSLYKWVVFFWISSDCISLLHYHRLCEIHLILFLQPPTFAPIFELSLIWTHLWRILKTYIGLTFRSPCPISLCAASYNCYIQTVFAQTYRIDTTFILFISLLFGFRWMKVAWTRKRAKWKENCDGHLKNKHQLKEQSGFYKLTNIHAHTKWK